MLRDSLLSLTSSTQSEGGGYSLVIIVFHVICAASFFAVISLQSFLSVNCGRCCPRFPRIVLTIPPDRSCEFEQQRERFGSPSRKRLFSIFAQF